MMGKCKTCKVRWPSYCWPGKSPTACKACACEGMVPKKQTRPRCMACNTAFADFGSDQKATHCRTCRTEGMTRVHHARKCKGCKAKQPSFSFAGQPATHCKDCKEPGMLPPYGRCQVCHITAANSGVDGKRTHCASCATDDMCQIGGYCIVCHDVTAAFGYERKTHCARCKEAGMSLVYDNKPNCAGCGIWYVPPAQGTLCSYCRPSQMVRTREDVAWKHLQKCFPSLAMVRDRKVAGGCSKRRPDVLVDAHTHFVAVEVDELQHASYGCDEHKRMLTIAQDCGMPTVFVRWNPDAWSTDGIEQHVPIEARLDVLVAAVHKAMESPPKCGYFVDALYYYYDDRSLGAIEHIKV